MAPVNECTGHAGQATQQGHYIHWAVEADAPGYVSVAFAENRAMMNPCDAVMGGVHDSDGESYSCVITGIKLMRQDIGASL